LWGAWSVEKKLILKASGREIALENNGRYSGKKAATEWRQQAHCAQE
jgi:hypothetical protein